MAVTVGGLLVTSLLFDDTAMCNTRKFMIGSVRFRNLRHITINTTLLDVPIHANSAIGSRSVDGAVHTLFTANGFRSIHILHSNSALLIRMGRHPAVTDVAFSNGGSIGSSVLGRGLRTSNIHINRSLSHAAVTSVRGNLRSFCCDINGCDTDIGTIIAPLPHGHISLGLIFRRNISTRVRRVGVINGRTFAASRLVSRFRLHSRIP